MSTPYLALLQLEKIINKNLFEKEVISKIQYEEISKILDKRIKKNLEKEETENAIL